MPEPPVSAGALSPNAAQGGNIQPASPSNDYWAGMELFQQNCAVCHGERAAGSDAGPPLVHPIYEPGHHPDFAFHAAVQRGVVSHHWVFGDMPPIPNLDEGQVDQVICYVRSLQRESGIAVAQFC